MIVFDVMFGFDRFYLSIWRIGKLVLHCNIVLFSYILKIDFIFLP